VQILNKIVSLISKLPPEALQLLEGLADSLLSAKSPTEAMDKLRKAALAVGYKKAARVAWREAVRGASKVK